MRVLLAKIIRGYLFLRRGKKEVWVGGRGHPSEIDHGLSLSLSLSDDEVVPGRPAVAP